MFWAILKVVFVLILITGMVYGTLYLLRKYVFAFDRNKSKIVPIKVLSTQMLMPKKFIQVVQIRDKVFVLGVSDHAINLIERFDDLAEKLPGENPSDTELKGLEEFRNNFAKDNLLNVLKKNLGMK